MAIVIDFAGLVGPRRQSEAGTHWVRGGDVIRIFDRCNVRDGRDGTNAWKLSSGSFVAWLWLEAASTGKRVGHDVDSGNRPEGAWKIEVDCHEVGKHRCKNVFSEKMTTPVVSTG
jgi:hypothetical protein